MNYKKSILLIFTLIIATTAQSQLEFKTQDPIDFRSGLDLNGNTIENISVPASPDGSEVVDERYVSQNYFSLNGDTLRGDLSANGYQIDSTDKLTFQGAIELGDTNSYAENSGDIAIGKNAYANDVSNTGKALAIGDSANASSYGSAIGELAEASGGDSVALGARARSNRYASTAIGVGSEAIDYRATAIGQDARANASQSTALGSKAKALNYKSTAIGEKAAAELSESLALGANAEAKDSESTAIGYNTTTNNWKSTAIGAQSTANADRAVAIGYQVTASKPGVTTLGSDSGVEITQGGLDLNLNDISFAKSIQLGPQTDSYEQLVEGYRGGTKIGIIDNSNSDFRFKALNGADAEILNDANEGLKIDGSTGELEVTGADLDLNGNNIDNVDRITTQNGGIAFISSDANDAQRFYTYDGGKFVVRNRGSQGFENYLEVNSDGGGVEVKNANLDVNGNSITSSNGEICVGQYC